MKPGHYLPQVREQYEALPYPPRDPADEKKRIVRTWLDDLAMINHYCFAGKQSFRDRFRVLVAGGGSGDSTIFLAEQLRHIDAEIVHLDISRAAAGGDARPAEHFLGQRVIAGVARSRPGTVRLHQLPGSPSLRHRSTEAQPAS